MISKIPGSRDELVRWNYRVPVLRESRTFIGVTQLIDKAFSPRPLYQPRYTLFGKLRAPQSVEEGWRRFELTIRSLNGLCRDRGVKALFAVIPPSPIFVTQDRAQTLNRMLEIVVTSGADTLNLQPHMRDDHYFREGHFNETGNEIVARTMIDHLRGDPHLLAF